MMEYGVTERWMRRGFEKFGRCLARHPNAFLLASLALGGILGGGLFFLSNEGSIEKLYTPEDGPAKVEREYVRANFPINDSEHFLPSRVITAGRYGAVIIRPRGEISDSVLDRTVLDATVFLQKNISGIVTEDLRLSYADVCAKWRTDCVVSGLDLLDFIAEGFPNLTVGYPWTFLPGGSRTFSGAILGDVSLKDGTETVKKAGALKLVYHLRSSQDDDDRRSEMWEKAFQNKMAAFSSDVITVTWSTSHSLESEITDMTTRAVPSLAAYTGSVLLAFAVLSCVMRDPVRSKPFLGMVGVLGAGMAVMATLGLFSYCGVSFNNLVAAMPFLVIGVGVDNMFILLAAWRRTSPGRGVEERAAETFTEAGVSITITALTNALAFAVGAITSFPGVRIFCLYSGVAVLFAYLFQINFFGACLIYDGIREHQNRHFLSCMPVAVPTQTDKPGCSQRSFYSGDGATGADREAKDHNDHLLMLFFKNYYGPFMTHKWVKAVVITAFLGYIAVAVWGCTQLREGVPLSKLAGDGSYVARYLEQDDQYFSRYDVRVAVMVTERVDYWDPEVQDRLEEMLGDFEDTDFTCGKNESESWLRVYLKVSDQIPGLNLTDKTSFMTGLKDVFLKTPGLDRFSYDLHFGENNSVILASRFFVQTKQIDDTLKEKHMMLAMRGVAKNAPVRTVVYHPAFVYYDQYTAILPNTLQNLGIATVAMLVVSLILMPHPIHALWVTLAIASICLGVVGFMTLWGTNLDNISMISLIMCIGFSVDFSAHFIYSFVSAEESSRNAKVVHALYSLGVPILQGSISTVLGVAALSNAPSYGFRTFFKTVFLVVVFGLLHGIVFLPAMLSCVWPKFKICKIVCCSSEDKLLRIAPAKSTADLPEIHRKREVHSITLTPVEGTSNQAYESEKEPGELPFTVSTVEYTTNPYELQRDRGASPFPIILTPD
ncbi:PREDICTED: patched domain-containing protein 3-like [Branchiostoma belcheri]|uniref:Patched domain-containing protein 3 n=1 Tax=Branchiostoma belcheri TaxID=7741 RepID=A0A6P4Y646_BRABE|nr:PREDICTED: patched domain-containing protein 3-like [Branchiostoma belcheri]